MKSQIGFFVSLLISMSVLAKPTPYEVQKIALPAGVYMSTEKPQFKILEQKWDDPAEIPETRLGASVLLEIQFYAYVNHCTIQQPAETVAFFEESALKGAGLPKLNFFTVGNRRTEQGCREMALMRWSRVVLPLYLSPYANYTTEFMIANTYLKVVLSASGRGQPVALQTSMVPYSN